MNDQGKIASLIEHRAGQQLQISFGEMTARVADITSLDYHSVEPAGFAQLSRE
ncbi:hypothetical protein [Bradyrhizobium sp. JR3.5]